MPSLFLKLLVSILAAGVIATCLLVIRQRQIDTVHEIARVHARLGQQERMLWDFQVQIARRCQPDLIRDSIGRLGNAWVPLPTTGHQPSRPPWSEQYAGSSTPGGDTPPADARPRAELGG
ncbi:MAG: hypothetical protein ACYTGG_01890 [Planctomycetota bacterium]